VFTRNKAGHGGSGKGATYSFIGPEVVVTGDIATPGQLHVDGKVVGDVKCGTLSQGDGGEIRGNILADEARLAGLIDGAVSAGSLLLEPTARVTGDVLYESLTVSTGAQVDGRFKRRTGGADGSSGARTTALAIGKTARPDTPALQAPGLFVGARDEEAQAAE
jgi:cytoskeletal protein CcmA (bactofilin family)